MIWCQRYDAYKSLTVPTAATSSSISFAVANFFSAIGGCVTDRVLTDDTLVESLCLLLIKTTNREWVGKVATFFATSHHNKTMIILCLDTISQHIFSHLRGFTEWLSKALAASCTDSLSLDIADTCLLITSFASSSVIKRSICVNKCQLSSKGKQCCYLVSLGTLLLTCFLRNSVVKGGVLPG